jgi:hypothetical protein
MSEASVVGKAHPTTEGSAVGVTVGQRQKIKKTHPVG